MQNVAWNCATDLLKVSQEQSKTHANRIDVSFVAEECLLGLLLPQIPQLTSFVDRAGDVSIAVGRQTDAHHVARVRLEVRRLLVGFEIPYAAKHNVFIVR